MTNEAIRIRLRSHSRFDVDSSGMAELQRYIAAKVALREPATIRIDKFGEAHVEEPHD